LGWIGIVNNDADPDNQRPLGGVHAFGAQS